MRHGVSATRYFYAWGRIQGVGVPNEEEMRLRGSGRPDDSRII